jgi:hypothetical protein
MHIEKIFTKYTDAISQIYLYQSSVRHNADTTISNLMEMKKVVDENAPIHLHHMNFPNIKTGQITTFNKKRINVTEKINEIYLLENRQYQWLLAEAHEQFEIFIKASYAYVGYIDINAWYLKDFNKITLKDLEEKDFHWYLDQVKARKNDFHLKYILDRFTVYFTDIADIEKDNFFKVNIKLLLIFIKELRNCIVHSKGEVLDKDELIKEIFQSAGLSPKGRLHTENKEYLESFFGRNRYKNLICLLRRINQEKPQTYFDILEELINYQISYAHLLTNCLKNKTK